MNARITNGWLAGESVMRQVQVQDADYEDYEQLEAQTHRAAKSQSQGQSQCQTDSNGQNPTLRNTNAYPYVSADTAPDNGPKMPSRFANDGTITTREMEKKKKGEQQSNDEWAWQTFTVRLDREPMTQTN